MDGNTAYALAAVSIFGLIALLVLNSLELDKIRTQAIERNYALYCPDTGEWSWVGECAP